MIELLKSLEMDATLAGALELQGITVPTEIQRRVIPEAVKGRDLIVRSETGTGKTLAYLLPLFGRLNAGAREMQTIILSPTHELSIQILRQIERLSQNSAVKLTSVPIIGDVNIKRQIELLKARPNIIVGSPGRVLELIKDRKISAHTIKTIVLDEADRLLDDRNLDTVKAVIKTTLKERQLMMFSATMSPEAEARGRELMKEPESIKGEEKLSVPDTIEHMCFLAERRDRLEVLKKLLRILEPQKAVIFVKDLREVDEFTAKLQYHGFGAEGIHGSDVKLDRKKAMEDFRAGRIRLLVASDLAARGLDLANITHVFSLNLPEAPGDYLHRAGRTGRNGSRGTSVCIAARNELQLIKKYEKALNIAIKPKSMFKGRIQDVERVKGS